MRTRTEILDAIRDAEARFDKTRNDLDDLLRGKVQWMGVVPSPNELLEQMVSDGAEIQVLRWVLEGK